jgi:hypothetical protein
MLVSAPSTVSLSGSVGAVVQRAIVAAPERRFGFPTVRSAEQPALERALSGQKILGRAVTMDGG